jgi:hypothetical protein
MCITAFKMPMNCCQTSQKTENTQCGLVSGCSVEGETLKERERERERGERERGRERERKREGGERER